MVRSKILSDGSTSATVVVVYETKSDSILGGSVDDISMQMQW